MRMQVRAGLLILAMAVSAGLAQGQQSKAAKHPDGAKKSSNSAVKQEFGPQTMPRRGDRTTMVPPDGQSGSAASQPAAEPAGKTEKIKFKQEFGPQTPSRRGDRMAAGTPEGQSDSHGSQAAGESAQKTEKIKFKQEFGPSQGTKHQDASRQPPAKNHQKEATSKTSR